MLRKNSVANSGERTHAASSDKGWIRRDERAALRDASYASRRVQQVVERHPGVRQRACVFGVFGGSVEHSTRTARAPGISDQLSAACPP